MSAEGQIIPDDIMKAAERALDNLLCNCRESCGSSEGVRQASIKDIATAIHSERKRCASVARGATMMSGAPIQDMGDEVAAAVLSQPTLGKFWMVYGVGQRAPAFTHHSKASARAEGQRLANLYPEITFVVLAAVDAYRTDAPVMHRMKIAKPAPAETFDGDDIPF